ncbi:MAG TPA: RidA family protein [Ktedonobacteraceae bacterium]|nr:RidA family protein [Ktedonobacteraceae bacterium]
MSRRQSIEIEGLSHGGMPIPLASKIGNVLISGGMMGMEPGSGTLPENIEEQCHHLFNNVRRLMEVAGGSLDDILKMTFYVKDRTSRAAINREWVAMFPDEASRPARHTLSADLPGPLLVQCEIYAILQEEQQ